RLSPEAASTDGCRDVSQLFQINCKAGSLAIEPMANEPVFFSRSAPAPFRSRVPELGARTSDRQPLPLRLCSLLFSHEVLGKLSPIVRGRHPPARIAAPESHSCTRVF